MKDFPVISIEDPFDQDDFDNSKKLTAEGMCQVLFLFHPCASVPAYQGIDR